MDFLFVPSQAASFCSLCQTVIWRLSEKNPISRAWNNHVYRQNHCWHGQHILPKVSSASPSPKGRARAQPQEQILAPLREGRKEQIFFFVSSFFFWTCFWWVKGNPESNCLMESSLSKCFHSWFKYSSFLTPIITFPCSKAPSRSFPSGSENWQISLKVNIRTVLQRTNLDVSDW